MGVASDYNIDTRGFFRKDFVLVKSDVGESDMNIGGVLGQPIFKGITGITKMGWPSGPIIDARF